MKACAVAAVSAALIAARAHAEEFWKKEVFSDAACTTLMHDNELMDMAWCHYSDQEIDGERFVAYYDYTCAGGESTKRYYSDSDCTTPHPNVTRVETLALDTCIQDGTNTNRYMKMTCPFSKTLTVSATMRTYLGPGCSGDHQWQDHWPIDECMLTGEYDYTDHTWTPRSSKFVQEGDRIASFKYTDDACGAGAEKEWASPCNACGVWDTDGSYEIQCPWVTTATTTTTVTTATTTTTGEELTTGAPPQALITAAHVVPLAGLLASAVL